MDRSDKYNHLKLFMLLQKINLFMFTLQEALSKAAGKKNKTPVQLDLGDMLAALEKQQQAMKARQITNTRPLSYTGGIISLGDLLFGFCNIFNIVHLNHT